MTNVPDDDILDQFWSEGLAMIERSRDLTKASGLSHEDVATLIDFKLSDDFELDDFSEKLSEFKGELIEEVARLKRIHGGNPYSKDVFNQARDNDAILRGALLNIGRCWGSIKNLEADSAIWVDHSGLLCEVGGMMMSLAKVRIAKDLVPLVARGIYAQDMQSAITFWNQHRSSDEGKKEATWQKGLRAHMAVLCRALGGNVVLLGEQQHVGAAGLDGAGGRVTDYILKHAGTRNVTLVEIKTPHTRLLGGTYRGTYPLSAELSGGVAQVLIQRNELTKNFWLKSHRAADPFEVDAPRCIVIAGSMEEFAAEDGKANAFEIQRAALSASVQIITFDELFEQFKQFNMAS